MEIKHLVIEEEKRNVTPEIGQTYRIKNTRNNQYVRLGMSETKYLLSVLKRLDCAEKLNLEGVQELSKELREKLDEKFEEWGFLDENNTKKKKSAFEKIKKIHILEFNVQKILQVVHPIYSKFFSKASLAVLISMILFVIGFFFYGIVLATQSTSIKESDFVFQFSAIDVVWIVLYFFINTILHEFAHAVTCIKYGGKVKSMGLMLFYFVPCFYCDVSDVYMIDDRKKRAVVAVSGILTNLFIGNVILIIAIILTYFREPPILLYYLSISTLVVSIYNFIPFVKLDGYWIVSALSGMDNFMDKSVIIAYTSIFRRRNLPQIKMKTGKRVLISLYGLVSLFFHSLFWFYALVSIQNLLRIEGIWKNATNAFVIFFLVFDITRNLIYYHRLIKEDYDRILMLM